MNFQKLNFANLVRLSALIVLALAIMTFFPVQIFAQEPVKITKQLIVDAEKGEPFSAFMVADDFYKKGGAENTEQAIRYFSIAFKGYNALEGDERFWAGIAAIRLADANMLQAKFLDAIRFYQNAIGIIEEHLDLEGAVDSRITAFMGIARSYVGLERHDDALELIPKVREFVVKNLGPAHRFVPETYSIEANALDGLEKYDQAVEANLLALEGYKSAFGSESSSVSDVLNNIAASYILRGDFHEARIWLRQAEPLIIKHYGRFSDPATVVQINFSLASLETNDYDEAIRWALRALSFVRENESVTLGHQRWLFNIMSRSFYAKGDVEKAITFGKLAVNAQQAIRQQNSAFGSEVIERLQNKWRRLYDHLASILIDQGRIAEAQVVFNMQKEEEVFNFLKRDASAGIENTTAILSDVELSEQQKIDKLSEFPVESAVKLFDLMKKIENGMATQSEEDQAFALQDALAKANEVFDAKIEEFISTVKPAEVESFSSQFSQLGSIQALLEEKPKPTAMLQIASLADKTHLFLTLPNLNVHEEVSIKKAALASLVFESLQLIEQRSPDAQAKLSELYSVLFAPIREALGKTDTQIVMLNLNDFLRYVPFSALFDGEKYLIENFAFALYTPTIETEFSSAGRERTKTAGFGVTAAHPGFSPLPGVAQELETIFSGTDQTGVLSGPTVLDQDFDRRSLRRALLRKPSILHIASHFNLVPGQEDDSFLLLGDGSHLKLSEIRKSGSAFGFKGVDLVTLSACQTAIGGGDGSELEGFGAVAQSSGASAVMASLWPVADDATPILMRDFYHSMIDEGMTKAEALRVAQVAMLTGDKPAEIIDSLERGGKSRQNKHDNNAQTITHAHPYFWSPFVLMGNWL